MERKNIKMDYTYEHDAYLRGCTAVCGIDEAGRGPLAGPVYAAAVLLPEGLVIDGLNDSKKLSEKKRELLFPVIQETRWPLASASPTRRRSTRSTFYKRRSSRCAAPLMRCSGAATTF